MPAGTTTTTPHRLPQPKSLQIKQDDKFFSRLLSKESSIANPSFRVYYGVASGAVPFVWESQPGTPKHTFSDSSLIPPLTPPPSYHFNFNSEKKKKKKMKPNLNIFPKLAVIRRSRQQVSPTRPSSPLSSSSWSSSFSSRSSKTSNFHRRRSSSLSSLDSRAYEEVADPGFRSPTSTLCFGVGREKTGQFRGCYSMAMMRNALSSIIGPHGSGQGAA